VNRPVRGAQEAEGWNSESVAIREDLGTNAEKFPSGDNSENAGDSAQVIASSLGHIANTRFLVDGSGALADGKGRAVNGIGNISRSRREGDARSDLRQAATRSANNGSGGACIGTSQKSAHASAEYKLIRVCVLRGGILDSLASLALNNLEGLVGLILGGIEFLLDRRAESLGARVEVASKARARGELGRVLSEVLIKSSLELALLVAFIARDGC
jgi:hypothetical protein